MAKFIELHKFKDDVDRRMYPKDAEIQQQFREFLEKKESTETTEQLSKSILQFIEEKQIVNCIEEWEFEHNGKLILFNADAILYIEPAKTRIYRFYFNVEQIKPKASIVHTIDGSEFIVEESYDELKVQLNR